MKFICPSCDQKISADEVQAGALVCCPACAGEIHVPLLDAIPPGVAIPVRMNALDLFVAKNGRETGPFKREQLPPMLESGMLSLTDSVWHEGLADWTPVHRFLGVRPPVPAGGQPSGRESATAGVMCPRESWPIKKRAMSHVILWMILSFGLYGIYLIAAYSPEVAKITGRRRLEFHVVLLLTIFTCGLFGMIYHCILAYKIWNHSLAIELPGRDPKLADRVWLLNFGSFVLAFSSAGFAIPVSVLASAWSVWLLQQELNRYADRESGIPNIGMV